MLVEFIGLPGSGKTTIASGIYRHGEILGKRVHYPLYELYKKPWWVRNGRKFFNIMAFAVGNSSRFFNIIRMILSSGQRSRMDYIRLCFNSLYIFQVVKRYSNDNDIILLDEGVLHHGWAVKIGAIKSFDLDSYLNMSSGNSLVVYVKCDIAVVEARMIERGKSNSRHELIKNNLDSREKIMQECISCLSVESLITLENNGPQHITSNTEEIIELLEKRI